MFFLKRFLPLLLALVFCVCLSVPVFAVDSSVSSSAAVGGGAGRSDASSVVSSSSSSSSSGEDLSDAVNAITDAQKQIDGIYDNLPQQNGNFINFLIGTEYIWPAWFMWAVSAGLIFSIFILCIRFLWK